MKTYTLIFDIGCGIEECWAESVEADNMIEALHVAAARQEPDEDSDSLMNICESLEAWTVLENDQSIYWTIHNDSLNPANLERKTEFKIFYEKIGPNSMVIDYCIVSNYKITFKDGGHTIKPQLKL
jgi:hypothetical protein